MICDIDLNLYDLEVACQEETGSQMAWCSGKSDDVELSLGKLKTGTLFEDLKKLGHGRRM